MIKRLGGCIREYKKASILSPVLVTIEVILEIVIPLLMAALIDDGIEKSNMSEVIKWGVILLIVSVFTMLTGMGAGKFCADAGAGFAANIREDMFFNVQKFSFANIDKFSTASIVTRLTTDVNNIQNAYMMLIRTAFRSPAMFLFAFVAAFNVSPKLALIYICCVPVLAIGLYLITTKAHPHFKKVFKTYDRLNNVVQENLYGMRVVKSFIREDFENKKFKKISDDIYYEFSTAEKILAFNAPLMQICMYGGMLLVSWVGAKLIVTSGNDASIGLSTGQLMSMFTYATQILMSLMMLSMLLVMFTMARSSGERIVEILDEKPEIESNADGVREVKDGSVVFENVNFSYSKNADKNVLENINISIKSGETVGIIGGTGSSKSSLVQLIPRLYDISSGRLLVGGVDVRDYDIHSLRDQVAMVLQKNVLFSGTIKENLRWGNENATDEQLIKVCKLACADEFITKFPDGYDTHIEQGGSNVSGGQKQRLCIARALLKKPKILILDDSTSAVDTKTDALIRKAFAEEIPDTTKIIIAQRISSVENADKIIVIDDGKINAVGTHESLIKDCDIYREVFESQMKGGEDNA